MLRSDTKRNQKNKPMRIVKVTLDDGKRLETGTPLELSGNTLLVDSPVEMAPGTKLRLVPIVDDETRVRLLEFDAEVNCTFIDVMVSAYADNRFILSLKVPRDPELLPELRRFVDEAVAMRRAPKKRRAPHRSGLIACGFWNEASSKA